MSLLEILPTVERPLPPPAIQYSADERVVFFDLSFDELADLLYTRHGLPRFRAGQVFEWVYRKRITDFSLMTNISKEVRAILSETFDFPVPQWRDRQISKDGTRKYLFEVSEGGLVEAVMIKQPTRMTLCVSSQVGCGMGCKFCRTATMGFGRHLKTSEILQQVLGVIDDAKNFDDMFSNVVFMGMGEPLHNFDGVTRALSLMTDPRGLAIGGRKITVSSVGLVPAIERFGQLRTGVNLAISLNATTDDIRKEIMPINKAYPLERLRECLKSFPLKKGRRITIEYVMLHGVNDTAEDLKRLPKILRGIPSKINLIPYNENAGLGFSAPPKAWIAEWQSKLNDLGFCTTVRWSKGADISAACGQLAHKAQS
jgi:23S rRNA (adenine2503-C2)-methyltransferase